MIFYNVLFFTSLLLGAITVCESKFHFCIKKTNSPGRRPYEDLSSEYSFEEGAEYAVRCGRPGIDWDRHWEVEPYGLKSSSTDGRKSDAYLFLSLHRDDQITLRCSNKNKYNNTVLVKSTTFIWDRKPASSTLPPPEAVSADKIYADNHTSCYTRHNTEHCAAILCKKDGCHCFFYLRLYTRINHDHINGVVINECYGPCYCTKTNGSSSCECLQGYNKNATGWCEDINECHLNISDCKKNERCWNTEGSFKCCANDTILDKSGNCVGPDHHIYDHNQGCTSEQRVNTSCGLETGCKMVYARAYCSCPTTKGSWFLLFPQDTIKTRMTAVKTFDKNTTFNDATTFDDVTIFKSFTVFNAAAIFNDVATLEDDATFNGTATFNDVATFKNNTVFNGTVIFKKLATFNGVTFFNDAAVFKKLATFNGVTVFNGASTFYVDPIFNNIHIFNNVKFTPSLDSTQLTIV